MDNQYPARSDFPSWMALLGDPDLPVCQSTITALEALKATQEQVLPKDISTVVLRDPLMSLRVLRLLGDLRDQKRLRSDTTTIDHSLRMIGVSFFFSSFSELSSIEEVLAGNDTALAGFRRVARRGYIASHLAQEWAVDQYDMESEEVQVAALLHDVAEMLLWLRAPGAASEIDAIQEKNPDMRSAVAQNLVLGFPLRDAEHSLCDLWALPDLLTSLIGEKSLFSRRGETVALATRITRHILKSDTNPALPDDWKALAKLHTAVPSNSMEPFVRSRIAELNAQWDALNLARSRSHGGEGELL